ncbi:MAG: magnesium transporter [Candidatus Izemoplasmataceae bacterium]
MDNKNYEQLHQEILELIDRHSPKMLQEKIAEYDLSLVASLYETLDDESQRFLALSLGAHTLAKLFEYIDESLAAKTIEYIEHEKAAHIIEKMEKDDAVDILNELDQEDFDQVMFKLDESLAESLKVLSSYEEYTAGSIMIPDYITVKKGMDVKDAMRHLVKNAKTTEGIQRLFVVDEHNFLEGVIELKALIKARSPKLVDELIITDIVSVYVDDDIENVARLILNYGIYLTPVVNQNHQLLGVITMDDAIDILEEENDEDYARLATISSDELINESLLKSALHRLPWLIVLLLIGILIASIINQFESTLNQVTIIVFFMPLIIGMAGNTGTQSLAVTVRGISKDYFVYKGNTLHHIVKEFKIGLYNGIFIGLFAFVTSYVFMTLTGQTPTESSSLLIAFTVSLSTFFSLILASTIGALFPLLLNKLKFDPSIASGPFITTFNDILGIVIYFSLATWLIL